MLVPVEGSLGKLELPRRVIQRSQPQRQPKPTSVSFRGPEIGWRNAYQNSALFPVGRHEESIAAALSTLCSTC
jgi:hypothetical protein